MAWDILGPLAGVVIGGVIAARLARDAFIRDQSMMEQRHRRETFAAYQKALWAYAGRVKVARDLVAAAPAGAPPPDQILATLHDIALTKQRQDACRNAVADLRMFADHETQLAAWAAYEAVSESFNALVVARDKAMSDRAFRDYEEQFTRFATALNAELEGINYMLYAYQTPLWRAVLRWAGRKPLPFVADPRGDPGTALADPRGEKTTPIR